MELTSNVNVKSIDKLISPQMVKNSFPLTEKIENKVIEWREQIANIISGKDSRLLVVVGPCSIHDKKSALEYAQKLKIIADSVSDQIMVVMRVYFEKPRTTIGWKGLINDPFLDGTCRIDDGLKLAREILLSINNIGLPVGCEFLDVFTPQYYDDLVSWGAIGARTTESQLHRQLASGLSVPIGFKNGTGGTISIAGDAVISAKNPHVFIGVDGQGIASLVSTKGNQNCHIILRGGSNGPNYHPQNITQAMDILKLKNLSPRVMIDCSHGNSLKNHKNQSKVLESLIYQIRMGNSNIFGMMIESHLNEGKQKLDDPNNLKYGVSITDSCINIEETELMLHLLANMKKSNYKVSGQNLTIK